MYLNHFNASSLFWFFLLLPCQNEIRFAQICVACCMYISVGSRENDAFNRFRQLKELDPRMGHCHRNVNTRGLAVRYHLAVCFKLSFFWKGCQSVALLKGCRASPSGQYKVYLNANVINCILLRFRKELCQIWTNLNRLPVTDSGWGDTGFTTLYNPWDLVKGRGSNSHVPCCSTVPPLQVARR